MRPEARGHRAVQCEGHVGTIARTTAREAPAGTRHAGSGARRVRPRGRAPDPPARAPAPTRHASALGQRPHRGRQLVQSGVSRRARGASYAIQVLELYLPKPWRDIKGQY